MINQMQNKFLQTASKHTMLFAGILLLCSCDGGIFGTGGPDTMGLDAGLETDVSMGSPIDMTDGASDAGAGMDGGQSDAGSSDSGATEGGGNSDSGATGGTPESLRIENTTATLPNSDVLVRIVNTSNTTINVFDVVDVRKDILYGDNGIAPGRISAANPNSQGEYQLEIFDNDDLSNILLNLSPLRIGESTFTTLVFRSSTSGNSILALPTELSTSDAALAKLRVIQAGSFDNPESIATFTVLSGGENPGGIDVAFEGLSYNEPTSDYTELPAGDYLLSDSLVRFVDQAFSVAGGEVYTVLVTDNGATPLLIITDSDDSSQ
jgi:hypothetical protein